MLELFLTFAKIGLFTIGGGYAMIGVIEDAVVSRKKWMTHEEMAELLVIAESTPGPIAVNCSTYVGYRQKGLAGAAAGTLGMVMPSFVIIFLISMFLDNFLEIGIIASAFRGMKVGVGIVILNAGLNMMKKAPKDRLARLCLLFGLVAVLTANILAVKVSSVILMLLAGAVTLAVTGMKGGLKK